MKKLQSFEEACEITGHDPKPIFAIFDQLPEPEKSYHTSLHRLTKGIEAQNKLSDFIPKYGKDANWKFEPIFEIIEDKSKPSGFGLSCTGFGDQYSRTGVGSRLSTGSYSDCEHMAELLKSDYEVILLPQHTPAIEG